MLYFDQSPPILLFQVLQSVCQSFGDCTKSTNYNWYNHHFHVPHIFQFPSKVKLLIIIIIIVDTLDFFTSVSPDGLSLEFEWQQVSSSRQDSSQYSGRFQ